MYADCNTITVDSMEYDDTNQTEVTSQEDSEDSTFNPENRPLHNPVISEMASILPK
jgi:hypothetical protein